MRKYTACIHDGCANLLNPRDPPALRYCDTHAPKRRAYWRARRRAA